MNDWWRFIFAYPALLNILQGLMFLFVFKYESPYWLVKNGKSEEALSVLSSLYVYDVDKVYEQISSVKADPLDSEITGPYLVKIGKMFTTPKVKKMLRLALMFNFNMSIGPVLLPYISEIGIPLANSLCVGILWLGFLVVGIIVLYAIAGFGPGPLFYIFMGTCLMWLIYNNRCNRD
jgi:hypothetical protein